MLPEPFVFDLSVESDKKRLEEILAKANRQVETREEILLRTEGKTIITDDNMGTEWRRDQ